VVDCLRSGWIGAGPRGVEFERRFADYVGSDDAVATSSGTAALRLALWSLDLRPGDEVITTAFTWVSVPNLVAVLGGTPVFCDIDAETLNLDLADVERRITPRTKAIVPVHFAGRPVDLDRLHAIAEAHGLVAIEDASHALGGQYAGRPVGAGSALAAFSFHPAKNITTGEGGMLTGRDVERLNRARGRRYHGVTRDASGPRLDYDVVEPGLKYTLSDIGAALGLVQLGKLEDFVAVRAQRAARYQERLAPLPGVWTAPPETRAGCRHAWHLYNIRLDDHAGLRDRVASRLTQDGVGVGLHYRPVHEMTWSRNRGTYRPLPVSEAVGRTILSLPLHPGLSEADVDYVAERLAAALEAEGSR